MTLTSASTVREMARHEQDTVRALLIEAFLLYQPHFPDGVFGPYLRELLDFTTADPVTLVAELGGQVVGTMRLYQAGAPHGVPLPDGWAMVRAAAVVPGLRRTGVARALLAECERRAGALPRTWPSTPSTSCPTRSPSRCGSGTRDALTWTTSARCRARSGRSGASYRRRSEASASAGGT